MKINSTPGCASLLNHNVRSLSRRWLAALLPLLLAGCAANNGIQLSDVSLGGLFGSKQPESIVPAQALADIGVTQCDRLTADRNDPDRAPGIAHVQWHELDAAAAIPACEQALEQHPGHRRLQAQLARAYIKARFYDDAYVVGNEADRAGSIHAVYQLGQVYRDGKKDNEKAIEAFARAAKAGHPDAMTDLGWRLFERDGWGDKREAASWFQKAAETGNPYSLASFGDMYVLTDRQFDKAFPWYQRAEQQNYRHALYMIGRYYVMGFPPVASNPDLALSYFERAAQQGYEFASVDAAKLYLQTRYSSAASGGGGVSEPLLESERREKALYWLNYGMPKLSPRKARQ
ncbi:tetratricopeptide repeat protein [Pusillimonas sp.]|uniref:tetratricopeptide repeat protein n=1 Tax=Pusillimonas sp. TaxID=3040095 RepID=UPI0037C742D7